VPQSELVKRLTERRQAVWAEARELAEKAAAENRNFSAAEQTRWDGLQTELNGLDERRTAILEGERRARDAEDAFRGLRGTPPPNRPGRRGELSPLDQDFEKAFRSAIRAKNPAPIDVYTEDPRSFYQPGIEQRDTLTSTATQALRTDVYNAFVRRLIENSAVMAAGATVITTPTGENLTIPRDTAFVTSALTSEGGAISESDPTLTTSVLSAYKYGNFSRSAPSSRMMAGRRRICSTSWRSRRPGRSLSLTALT
jgi:HK97 family phage major capsid protein